MDRLRELWASRWARYAVTLAVVALVILKIRPEHLSSAARSVRPGAIVLSLLLTLPFLALKAVRWHLLLRGAGVQASFREAAVSLIGGMGLALITPARLGELVRVAYLRDRQAWKVAGLVLIDKGFDVLVLVLLSVAGGWLLLGPAAGALLAMAGVAGLALVYRPDTVLGAVKRVSDGGRIARLASGLEALGPGATTVYLLLTALSFVVVLVQFGILLASWRSPTASMVVLTFPLVVLTNVLPITVGGLGVRESAAVLLLAHYGVPASEAALAAFLMFAVNTALPGLAGGLLLPLAGIRPATGAVSSPDP